MVLGIRIIQGSRPSQLVEANYDKNRIGTSEKNTITKHSACFLVYLDLQIIFTLKLEKKI